MKKIQTVFLFLCTLPTYGQLVISEIMADPVPSAGLPECEYVELRNTGFLEITMDSWQLVCDDDTVELTGAVILPYDHLILCHASDATDMETYGEVFPVERMPNLSNAGEHLFLLNSDGQMVSCVRYTDEWYGDALKQEGGWSLEQVDASNPCAGADNWRASDDPRGGTPGRVNSVEGSNPDYLSPRLRFVGMPDSISVLLEFDEPLSGTEVIKEGSYHVEGVGPPVAVNFDDNCFHRVELLFAEPFLPGVRYHLAIRSQLSDCAGNNLLPGTTGSFELPALPRAGDVVINEVLYDPWPGGAEYVEIYNRSGKTMDLSDLRMATPEDAKSQEEAYIPLAPNSRLFYSGEYRVFTREPEIVEQYYTVEDPESLMEMERMPVLVNRHGTLVLAREDLHVVDRLAYHGDMHFPLHGSAKGASLERVHFDRPSHDPSNWHTAAQWAGFGTPTYRNSQFAEPEAQSPAMTISSEVFSPDQDGRDDLLHVNLKFNRPGYVANVRVYDARGRLVRVLADHQTTGTESAFTWDGLDEHRRKARLGIYLIHVEAFHLSGDTKVYRRACVLGGKL
jgi:YD repeat-containing protein